jgi:hypothetical protein
MRARTTLNRSTGNQTIAGMAVGESAYVSPSALFVTRDRACHLLTDFPVSGILGEETSLHVTRTAQGYIADVTHCNLCWEARDELLITPRAPVMHVVFGDEFLQ